MGWLAILFIVVLIVIFWLLFGNKQKAVSEPASAVPTRSSAPAPGKADDLKLIEGVGPKIAELMNNAGIITFAQMAERTSEELRKILDDGGIGAIADPTTWPEQAALAAQGKMDALIELQDKMQGGRQ